MVAKPTNVVLDFSLVVRVSELEFGLAFTHILSLTLTAGYQINQKITINVVLDFFLDIVSLTLTAGYQINQKITIASQVLFNFVPFVCVGAYKIL